ncbi:MAG: hypothetical protein RI885_236 [Actinomycetota bacterium]|jgi:hypothetical protein
MSHAAPFTMMVSGLPFAGLRLAGAVAPVSAS